MPRLLFAVAWTCVSLASQTFGHWELLPLNPAPPGRTYPSFVFDEARGEAVLFGGLDGTWLGDTWVLDANGWTQKQPATSPSPRARSAMAYDPVRERVVLFGGEDANPLDDIWEWGGTDWTRVASGVSQVGPGGSACYEPIRGSVLYAGELFTGLWDGTALQELQLPNSQVVRDTPIVFDASAGGVIARLGQRTWVLGVLRGWLDRGLAQGFSLDAFAMAHDPTRNLTLLQGGDGRSILGTGSSLGFTWAWNGATWVQAADREPLLARHAMIFDPNRGALLMFGGRLNSSFSVARNDVYIWRPDPAPATWESLGVGCGGSTGLTPTLEPDPSLNSAPVLGGFWFVRLSDLPPGASVLGIGGVSARTFQGLTLPFDLGGFGMPGCSLFAAPEITAPLGLSSPTGTARWLIDVPADPGLAGLQFFQQAAVLAPGANSAGVVWTNAGRGVLGS